MFNRKFLLYNMTIMFLALVAIILVVLDFLSVINIYEPPFVYLDLGIWIIFIFDYFYRFHQAEDKRKFFISNIFDLIAILPFALIFSVFKIGRIFHMARISRVAKFGHLIGFTGKFSKLFATFFATNGFIHVLEASAALVCLSSAIYSIAEKVPFRDALWWALVTTTTVGYGDISPQTGLGRFAAVLLMFVGIGFIGFLISTITEFFSKLNKKTASTELELDEKIDLLLEKTEQLEKDIQILKKAALKKK